MFDELNVEVKKIQNRGDDSDFKDAIHWRVTINGLYDFYYSEGIGHFVKTALIGQDTKRGFISRTLARVLLGDAVKYEALAPYKPHEIAELLTERVKLTGNRYTAKHLLQSYLITPPKIDDIMYSLTMDASGTNEDFTDWCFELGYDDDSIKARDMYNACTRTAKILRCLGFNLDELQEYFLDY